MKGKLTDQSLYRLFLKLMNPELSKDKNRQEVYDLGISQKRQLAEYCMKEAEKYPNTHSMRYSIMKYMTCAILNIPYEYTS